MQRERGIIITKPEPHVAWGKNHALMAPNLTQLSTNTNDSTTATKVTVQPFIPSKVSHWRSVEWRRCVITSHTLPPRLVLRVLQEKTSSEVWRLVVLPQSRSQHFFILTTILNDGMYEDSHYVI